MKTDHALEKKIEEIGRELAASMDQVPSLFNRKRWMGRTMALAMEDEEFKLQLFRYIDVLPSLRTDALVVQLFREYLKDIQTLPPIMKKGLDRIGKGFVPFVAAKAIRSGVRALARQFIAGEEPEEALQSLESLWKEGCAGSVDLLGEEVLSDEEAESYRQRYLGLLASLGQACRRWSPDPLLESDHRGALPRVDVSLKVTSLYSQLDPIDWSRSVATAKENLLPLIAGAEQQGVSVCFDMEQYHVKDLILDIFKQTVQDAPAGLLPGVALQAYLRESEEDLQRLISWAKEKKKDIRIRLVKGAYWDYEVVVNRQRGWPVPVFLDKAETDLSFERLTRMLLENADLVRPAIASHNIRSISSAIAMAEALGLPQNAFEFQMLFGMGDPLKRKLRDMGYRVRVYAPVGELIPGMAYLVRRLLENTSNVSFLRTFFAGEKTAGEILQPPSTPHRAPEETSDEFRNEPLRDYSKAENRKKMTEALASVKKAFGRKYPLSVGGEEVYTAEEILSGSPIDPSLVVGGVSSAEKEDADRALSIAAEAEASWRKVPAEARAEYLFRAASELRAERDALAALEVYEVGKTWREADGDVAEAIDHLEYYGREMLRIGRPRKMGDYPGEANEYFYMPRGVGVVISPWNFPLAIPAGMVSAALVTGNCVIFKPSGLSPVTGRRLVDAFRKAGLPAGVLQFLPGPGDTIGEYLVGHRDVDFIAFTGSKDVGLKIVSLAAETRAGQRNVKKVIAEMGGKNAIIVDDTAEPDETVKGILESALGYQGQKCSACSRVVATEGIYEELLRRLKSAMESIRIGDPADPGTFMGPVIGESAADKIRGFIGRQKEIAPPFLERRAGAAGYFIGPVIFRDVDPQAAIAQAEIFGPVLAVIRASDIDEAIGIANATPYALTGGLFSRSPKNIRRVREELRVGNLYLNRKITGALVGRQPFGGIGMSGVGSKAGGPDYLLQFMEPRSVSENTMRRGFAPL